MLGVDCLKRNPELRSELKMLIEKTMWDILAGETDPMTGTPYKGAPSVLNVYRHLRKQGFEIDGQTLSYLYGEVAESDTRFSQEEELEDFRNESYRNLVEAEAELMKVKKIGKDNAVVASVTKLMGMLKLMGENNSSIQKIIEERLMKAAKRVTGFKAENVAGKKTAADILTEVLSIERNNKMPGAFAAMDNAKVAWAEFKKEFNEMADILEEKGDVYNAEKIRQYSDILEGATYKFLMSTAEVQQVINETLKDGGYSKEVQSKNGSRQIVDWNKIFEDTNFDFTRTIKDVFRKKGFTEDQLDRIAEEMLDEWDKVKAAKMQSSLEQRNKQGGTKPQASAVKKLQRLYNLGIFDSAKQDALFKVLNVPLSNVNQIKRLQQLMAANNKALSSPIEEWSETHIKTIQREIEIIIEQAEADKEFLVFAMRNWGFFNQLGSALMLSNPQNSTENITSGAFQSILTSIATQPRYFLKTFSKAWTIYKDVVQGGTRVGQERGNTFNSAGVYEDMKQFESAKTLGEKAAAGLGFIARVVLSGPDNAFKGGMVSQIAIDLYKSELKRQGATSQEANAIINEALYGNNEHIEEIAKTMADSLTAAGLKVNKNKWKRIHDELIWANLASDGQIFAEILESLVDRGLVREGVIAGADKVLLHQMLKAAEVAASKGLGHEADNRIMKVFDGFSINIGSKVAKARKSGVGLGEAVSGQTMFGIANRFVYSAMRWMWLTLEKTSGILLAQTVLTDMLFPAIKLSKQDSIGWHLKDVNFDYKRFFNRYDGLGIDIDDDKTTQDIKIKERGIQLARYASLKQRLLRQSIGPVFSFGMMVLIKSLIAHKKGADSDDEKKQALVDFAVKMKGDLTLRRWGQKGMPPGMYNFISSLANVKDGKVVGVKLDTFDLPDETTALQYIYGIDSNLAMMAQTFGNNFNQSSFSKVTSDLTDLFNGKADAAGKLGGALMGMIVSNPLKAYDAWRNPFLRRELVSSRERSKLKPDNFWEGVEQQLVTEDWWENIKDTDIEKKWLWE